MVNVGSCPVRRACDFGGMMRQTTDSFGGRAVRVTFILAGCVALAGCAASNSKLSRKVDPKYGVSASPRVVELGQPVPKGGGVYRTGKPYVVGGKTYVPSDGKGYREEGLASWYGEDFHGRLTANGEVYDMESISAAHPTLPIPSYVRVTNKTNNRSIIVRVNDRGPYHSNRIIDLSYQSATLLGFRGHGIARVKVEFVGTAPLEGSDDRMLMATLRNDGPAPAPSRVMVASAGSFVPEAREATLTSSTRANIHGSIPMPAERPFLLGKEQQQVAAVQTSQTSERVAAAPAPRVTEVTAAARLDARTGDNTVMRWQRGPDAVVTHEPVSSFAPASESRSNGYLSGRGLY